MRDLRALHVEQADLAVAALANHLAAGGAVARVAWQRTGVRAAWGAGLGAAVLANLTLHGGERGLETGEKHDTHNKIKRETESFFALLDIHIKHFTRKSHDQNLGEIAAYAVRKIAILQMQFIVLP